MSVGTSVARLEGHDKATGRAQYPADTIDRDALWAVVVFTDQPHARLAALDVSAAERAPGVVGVLTAADVPTNSYGLTLCDQPVMVGPAQHSDPDGPACDVSRWEADHLALVIAESENQARRAAALIEARWEPLAVLDNLETMLAATERGDAPLLHPENGLTTNVYEQRRTRKGDMDAGWAAAVVVVEETYTLPHQEHAYLQPEAATAAMEDNQVVVTIAGQWAHEDRDQIARSLAIEPDAVRVIYPAIGGAFGGREDASLQIVMALGARWLAERGIDRQLAARWSREESIVGHHKRHRARVHARWGADGEGKLTAVEATAWLDAGAYNYTSNKVLANLHLGLAGAYEAPNAHVDSAAVYTTSVPGGAFRGFGSPQATFVAEGQMDRLAAALGIDPIEIRRRNLLGDTSLNLTNSPMPPPITISAVLEAAVTEGNHIHDATNAPLIIRNTLAAPAGGTYSPLRSLPPDAAALRTGKGVACAFKNVGFSFGFPERCEATIVAHGDEADETPKHIELYHAGAEVGQGAHTAFVQMAADAAGVDPGAVTAHFSDTNSSGDSGSASASRLTYMAGNAILGAWEECEKGWREGHRPAHGHFRFTPPPTSPMDPQTGECVPNFAYGYVAQYVEITVDIETGHIRTDRVVSAHDVGKAINPLLIIGQIEGAVIQAHGYALSERLGVHEGRITTPRLSTYLVPGIGDVPAAMTSVILETADERGPFGATGMAEMGLLPYAAAVAAALHDATGVWVNEIPLTPDRVLAALTPGGSASAGT